MLLGLVFAAAADRSPAQALRDGGHAALQQAVRDAGCDCLAVLVAAHPDDLWVLPAALLRFRYGWRVAVVLMTRGEGGQNSAGPEIGDDLGRLRTLEAEACADRLGVRTYYANRQDAGYCRTAAEALQLWNLETTAGDLARLFRRIRPDMLLTTHHPAEEHGHDLALLQILPHAVRLAADPKFVTPELAPITIERVFRGAAPAEAERADVRQLVFDEMDPVRGDTYRALAYAALLEHRSQAPFEPIDELCPPFLALVPLAIPGQPPASRLIEEPPSMFHALPAGPARDTLRAGLEGDAFGGGLRDLLGTPQRLVAQAVELRGLVSTLAAHAEGQLLRRLERRRRALDRVIVHGCALHATVVHAQGAAAVPGQELQLRVLLHNGEAFPFHDIRLLPAGAGTLAGDTVLHELPRKGTATLEVGYSVPAETGSSEVRLARLYRAERYEPPVQLILQARLQDQELALPIDVAVPLRPAVEIEVVPPRVLVPSHPADALTLAVLVHRNSRAPVNGKLQVRGPAGWVVNDTPVAVQMDLTTHLSFLFELQPPAALPPDVYSLHVQLDKTSLRVPAHKVAVQIRRPLRVGVVETADPTASQVLRGLGAEVVPLGDDDLSVGSLQFDTILVDFRALRRRPVARAAFHRLLDAAQRGARLVVFYHKDTEFNVDSAGFVGAPYPLHVGKGRVTHQDAPVTVLVPGHVLLAQPNELQPEDWDGWTQERGLYFPDRYDERYQELLAMADPGQPLERGSLLYARYGKGEYVYCALTLYRQLKNLHPGACRLFANLMTPAAAAPREGG